MKPWLTDDRLTYLVDNHIKQNFGQGKGKFGISYKDALLRILYELTHTRYESGVFIAYSDTYTSELAYQFQKWGCNVTWVQHWSGDVSWEITMPETREQELANKASLNEDWG